MGMEQMEKLISIIVPVYKVEKYIHKAVNSILEQTYKNLEVIDRKSTRLNSSHRT